MPWGGFSFHFTDERTEAQRGEVILLTAGGRQKWALTPKTMLFLLQITTIYR